MLSLTLILLVVAVALGVVLYVGSLFFQGYVYTEPSEGLFWQAPVAALVLTFFYAAWVYSVALSADATPRDIPYDVLYRFSPRVTMVSEPVKKLWGITKGGKKVLYVREGYPWLGQTRYRYVQPNTDRTKWPSAGYPVLELQREGQTPLCFERHVANEGGYREYVSDEGWVMPEFDEGPTGMPVAFRFGRMALSVFFNLGHLAFWFVLLWLVLRYQWAHALGLAAAVWLLLTLTVLPMLLSYAAGVAETNRANAPATAAWAPLVPALGCGRDRGNPRAISSRRPADAIG